MKKIISILFVLLALFLVACSSDENYQKVYNDVYKQTKKVYISKYNLDELSDEDFKVYYYGEYNGCYAVMPLNLKGYFLPAVQEYQIGEYKFEFGNSSDIIMILKGKELYELDEAFKLNLLTLNDFKELYKCYKNPYYVQTQYAYYNKFLNDFNDASYKDVEVSKIYLEKKHNDKVLTVMCLSSSFIANEKIDDQIIIENTKFEFEMTNDIIYVMYDNELYELDEAYNKLDFFKDYVKIVYNKYIE